jgi:hypothetical protein
MTGRVQWPDVLDYCCRQNSSVIDPGARTGTLMNVARPGVQGVERPMTLGLSIPRRVVCDLIHFAHRIPSVPVQRVIDVSRVAALRERLAVPVGWAALFTKAFALVARRVPEFRRAYLEYPIARLYQHPHSIASVAVEREFDGEPGVFFAHVPQPELSSLRDLEAVLARYKQEPVADMFGFILSFYRWPRFVRRTLWWYIINVRGSRKAQFLGTFGLSVYSALGAESLHPLSPLTTTLNYGVIGPDGRVTVRIIYDHRVMDGATVARGLGLLDDVLNNDICQELSALSTTEATAPPLFERIPSPIVGEG